jgi:uncharacterized protein (UPF0548 family)
MFLLRRPDRAQIDAFLRRQERAPYSYPEVAASRTGAPPGYTVDRYRLRLGTGPAAFERASAALQRWAMFETGWTELYRPDGPAAAGQVVCSLVHHLGFWSLNSCRVIYVIDEGAEDPKGMRRIGFAFGTLTDHAEQGEERFTVEYNRENEAVWYDVLAFSRPRSLLAWVGYPITRALQKHFIRDSKQAMERAASCGDRDITAPCG